MICFPDIPGEAVVGALGEAVVGALVGAAVVGVVGEVAVDTSEITGE